MHFAEQLPSALTHFLLEEAGASITEYVLLAALIIVVCKIGWLALNKGA